MTLALPEPRLEQGATVHRFNRREYYRMGQSGLFDGRRVQLIDGQIIDMAPQNYRHAATVERLNRLMVRGFGDKFRVRPQLPVLIDSNSEPEPDIAVVPGSAGQEKDHPRTASLVIEVSDTTLRLDRRKAALYASIKVPEYWIVNLVADCVEVYRGPVRGDDGWRYDSIRVAGKGETISPLAKPRVKMRVASLLA
ncbi:MAG TPA: Uma2 family endonuclease [Tepidisphaeraceae bacterium]|nr:Uma2 family endonuclease [Tepidisphaeraceae bacterium]